MILSPDGMRQRQRRRRRRRRFWVIRSGRLGDDFMYSARIMSRKAEKHQQQQAAKQEPLASGRPVSEEARRKTNEKRRRKKQARENEWRVVSASRGNWMARVTAKLTRGPPAANSRCLFPERLCRRFARLLALRTNLEHFCREGCFSIFVWNCDNFAAPFDVRSLNDEDTRSRHTASLFSLENSERVSFPTRSLLDSYRTCSNNPVFFHKTATKYINDSIRLRWSFNQDEQPDNFIVFVILMYRYRKLLFINWVH